jgi:hypothetical protein
MPHRTARLRLPGTMMALAFATTPLAAHYYDNGLPNGTNGNEMTA